MDHDPLVLAYSHLRDFPRADDALHLLRRVASLVKPLMRARRWKVRELAEFFPDQANLLGLNINRGQRILLRLRYPGDRTQFLPLESIADTLLHELAHIVQGPHDAAFYALWNQLRDEHMALVLKGFTGEGFLSEGHRLGDSGHHGVRANASLSRQEARRLAEEAERRRRGSGSGSSLGGGTRHASGSGHRLGGRAPQGTDMRRVIAEAAAQRFPPSSSSLSSRSSSQSPSHPSKSHSPSHGSSSHSHSHRSHSHSSRHSHHHSSHSHSHSHRHSHKHKHNHNHHHDNQPTCGTSFDDQARQALDEQATRNGFRTQAEEDAANEAAIAQALWEMVQEDERRRLGPLYLEPTAERPQGNGGGVWVDKVGEEGGREEEEDDDNASVSSSSSSSSSSSIEILSTKPVQPVQVQPVQPLPPVPSSSSSSSSPSWTCRVCTLHNPASFLCCDACGTQRPPPFALASTDRGKTKTKSLSERDKPSRRLSKAETPPPPVPPPPPPSKRQAALAFAAYAAGKPPSRSSSSLSSRPKDKGKERARTDERKRGEKSDTMTTALASSQQGSKTWDCTFCGRERETQWWTCDMCGKMKEEWQ